MKVSSMHLIYITSFWALKETIFLLPVKAYISESQQVMNFPFYLKSTLEHIEKDTMQIVTKPK